MSLTLKELHAVDKTESSIWVKYPSGAAERYDRDGERWT